MVESSVCSILSHYAVSVCIVALTSVVAAVVCQCHLSPVLSPFKIIDTWSFISFHACILLLLLLFVIVNAIAVVTDCCLWLILSTPTDIVCGQYTMFNISSMHVLQQQEIFVQRIVN
ncbi:hypothetical protein GQX74_005854 [Glossina fuscipes]|uniref:Uncharacterized protein n=1 Tax=Glossina palpalis gambiensis TaxID=67801 RepID=A0A1B0BWT5_9MUSC|nr:hypothetical protein GQX74_005854 [Glossina fuscipes]